MNSLKYLVIGSVISIGAVLSFSADLKGYNENNYLSENCVECDSICSLDDDFDAIAVDVSLLSEEISEFLKRTNSLPGCKHFEFLRIYSLNDSSYNVDFQIYIAQQAKMPKYIIDFASKQIRKDISEIFSMYNEDGELITPVIPLASSQTHTIEQMAELYYNQCCDLYKRNFGELPGSDDPVYNELISYQYCAVPVWKNSDSSLTTWKFYQFQYTGSAHGGSKEYFITFDNKTGRMLGIKDFFSGRAYQKAIDRLTQQLFEGRYYGGGDPDVITAALDGEEYNDVLTERIDGKVYPRPAIVEDGLVFSYQSYQKGMPTCEQLHLTQTFVKNFKLSKKKH